MPPLISPVAVHSIVGGEPYIISVAATAAPSAIRTFYGAGAPASGTLPAGNGMYNAAASGFVVNALPDANGSGYNVGDVLTVSGGTGTAMQITVDMVNGGGAIIDFHVSQVGNYSAYPTVPATVTGGAGSAAEFYLNFPAPDYYIDVTTPTAPVLYVCMTRGTNSTSIWAKISGGGGGLVAMYDTTGATAYSGGAIVFIASQFVLSGITVLPGTYALLSSESTPVSPTGNQIPQIPVPNTGTIYWIPIAAGLVAASSCASGATKQVFVNATSAF